MKSMTLEQRQEIIGGLRVIAGYILAFPPPNWDEKSVAEDLRRWADQLEAEL